MKQSNSACTLLTVLVLVLAGREVQRTFFGDRIAADEIADILGIQKGTWELPEIPDPSWFHVQLWKDGEYVTGTSTSHAESLRGDEVMPFYVRKYSEGGERLLLIDAFGGSATFTLSNYCGQDFHETSGWYTGPMTVGPDGVICELNTEERDGSHHEIVFRFAIKETSASEIRPTEGEAR